MPDHRDHPVQPGYGTAVIGLFLILLGMDTGGVWLYLTGLAILTAGTYTARTRR